MRMIRSDIRFRIEELFAANDIIIAFPQRDVHLYAKTPIAVTVARDTADSSTEGTKNRQ